MGDKQIGQSQILLQVLQQVDDLRLDGNIECAHWFITQHHLRLEGQGPGNGDPLSLPA